MEEHNGLSYPGENADEVFAKMKEQGLDRIVWIN